MKAYVEPAWSAVEKKLEELDLEEENERTNKFKSQSAAASASANNNDDNDDNNNEENLNDTNLDENDDYDDDFDESLFCVACNKAFKNEKSFLNHEKSKKHRDNIDLLKKHMKEEDKKVLFGAQCENDEMKNEETKQQQQEVNKSK
jgi:DnaJ family protein A protein 5